MQRDLGDVELVLADQLQQQVERTGEVVEAYEKLALVNGVALSVDRRRGNLRGGGLTGGRMGRLFRHELTVDHGSDNLLPAHS
ncbi:hypothetical protein [Actinoplanes bogorensis]|uniref:hypothetical protein n=1 Tax=Paractinoplanes bogorensis TaxID=1610840 RepID=UPI001FE9DBF1